MRELSKNECRAVAAAAGIAGKELANALAMSWGGFIGGVAISGFLGVGTVLTMGMIGAASAAVLALTVYHTS
ncbi:hypothetical protein GCM10011385_12160 [Nitratireductor aestuarii]|uniref:Uncharacterized protein n=1 Tax=Nitratireductor aestuarii TaxID=1735103 RepID=A0A916W248_9HYPH|nr:hypothetical protein [Nitratireductor aestuarii]GGA59988.1 hypothetical protein GCM10011385_12160 [Nitratireductor aestuarii]